MKKPDALVRRYWLSDIAGACSEALTVSMAVGHFLNFPDPDLVAFGVTSSVKPLYGQMEGRHS